MGQIVERFSITYEHLTNVSSTRARNISRVGGGAFMMDSDT